jgi:anti-sigma factor RsiW
MTDTSNGPKQSHNDQEMAFLIQAEIDGELSPADAARVAAYIEASESGAALRAELLAVSGRIRREASRFTPPDDFADRVRARLDAGTPALASGTGYGSARFRLPRPSWAVGSSFGAGFAIAAMLLLIVMPPRSREDLPGSVVADHVRALQPGHLLDVISSDHHTVRPWFDGRLDFAPPVKDLKEIGYPLRGGRLDYLDGRPVAALVYAAGPHLIDLYVWPAGTPSTESSGQRSGYNYVRWQQDGMQFWAVSDLARDELATFVRHWRTG